MEQSPRGYNLLFDQWGPCFWRTLHAVTFAYPSKPDAEDKRRMQEFFELVPFMLPCAACGLHFARALRETHIMTPEVLSSHDSLTRWLVDLHNAVNRRLNKPEARYEDVQKFYLWDSTHPVQLGRRSTAAGGGQAQAAAGGADYSGRTAAIIMSVMVAVVLLGLGTYFVLQKHQQFSLRRR